jgi:hypothetical protein
MHGTHRFIVLAAIAMTAQEAGQTARFNSMEVSGGAHVTLRPAATHSVRLLEGSTQLSRVDVSSAGTLVIDKCRSKCPKGYVLELEVFTPSLTRISVGHGGRVQSRAGFRRQAELAVEVNQGGLIDVRSIAADRVTASVNQGGGILTTPRNSLTASVTHGGNITYWGDPQVRSSVDHPGAVQKAAN